MAPWKNNEQSTSGKPSSPEGVTASGGSDIACRYGVELSTHCGLFTHTRGSGVGFGVVRVGLVFRGEESGKDD